MKALVVYESMYGNTHTVAEQIGEGLAELGEVVVVPVGEAGPEIVRSADLLVVGGPTHAHGMSTGSSRRSAVDDVDDLPDDLEVDPDAPGPGLRNWFKELDEVEAVPAAAFDTRAGFMKPILSGQASRGIHRRLHRHGFAEIVDPESFLVDRDNHLMDGEEERARRWGAALATEMTEALTD